MREIQLRAQFFGRTTVSAGIVALLALLLPSAAWAQGDAWYVAGGLGASLPADVDVRPTGVGMTARTVQLDTGILFSGAVGRSFGNFRAEGELVYNTNNISTFTVPGVGALSASGDVSTLVLMLNGYFDFPTNSKWKPYIGGGIGGGNVSINSLSVQGMPAFADDGAVFAYQFKVGVAYEFTQAMDGTLGYRFLGTEASIVERDAPRVNVIELGVRFRF
jgi:opacity protein-like surface antigen